MFQSLFQYLNISWNKWFAFIYIINSGELISYGLSVLKCSKTFEISKTLKYYFFTKVEKKKIKVKSF